MRRLRPALLTLLLLPALLAGCGGGEVEYEQVNSAPPVLEIPQGSNTGGLSAGEDSGADEDADADETPTPTPTASGETGATAAPTTAPAAPPTDTGGAAPEAEQPAPEANPEDTGGAGADEGLDQFCADNPGACDG